MTPDGTTAAWLARNAVASLPAGGLERRLREAKEAGRPLRAKLGLDPTAPDIHLGHAVVLAKLREFQDLGHRVVLIVGDYTARVGDPSGRSSTRPALSGEEIDHNARSYQDQALRILSDDPDLLEVRHNSQWLDMSMQELFRLARTTTVAQLLERDDFARRYGAAQPISVLELLYPLMQAYDSVAIDADVELGGTDQTFNLLLGREVQRAFGKPQQCVLTMPILAGLDGHDKMSKSLGNHIGVNDSAQEMFGRTLSLPDEAMAGWFSLLAIDPPAQGTGPRDVKRALARGIVSRFHDPGAAAEAEAQFDRVHVQHAVPDEVAEHELVVPDAVAHLPAVIAEAFGHTRSEARRLLAQGGVRLDGTALGEADMEVAVARLDGAVLQVGKRHFRRLRVG
jgi:tyrosyl-tRNA synthetase